MKNENVELKDEKLIEEKIGYHFKNKDLLLQAFIRPSYSEEHYSYENNQVLEFIGDKVLDLLIVQKLIKRYGEVPTDEEIREREEKGWDKSYYLREWFHSTRNEGELTDLKISLVEGKRLASVTEELGLQEYLIMGQGDIKNGVQNQSHVKEDLYEAILGAIALDCNWNLSILSDIIDRTLKPNEILDKGIFDKDYLGIIQDWWKKRHDGQLPPYKVSGSNGDFSCVLEFDQDSRYWRGKKQIKIYGDGGSEDEAIKMVAKNTYKYITDNQEIIELIGNVSMENAINKLQELWQKNKIGRPIYTFRETKDGDGNTLWECTCTVEDGSFDKTTYDSKKIDAKKFAARCILEQIEDSNLDKLGDSVYVKNTIFFDFCKEHGTIEKLGEESYDD